MIEQLRDKTLLREQAYINGAWVDADSGETVAVVNPSTGETVAKVPRCGGEETARAIDAANRALKPWQRKNGERACRSLARLV